MAAVHPDRGGKTKVAWREAFRALQVFDAAELAWYAAVHLKMPRAKPILPKRLAPEEQRLIARVTLMPWSTGPEVARSMGVGQRSIWTALWRLERAGHLVSRRGLGSRRGRRGRAVWEFAAIEGQSA